MDNFFLLCTHYWFVLLVIMSISYLIGGISFSILVTKKICGREDIRTMGSGNAGFTNVLRSAGRWPAIITFVGDFAKGVMAVWIGKFLAGMQSGLSENSEMLQYIAYIAGFMCVIGHIYPCFFQFKGGKGILTSWAVTLLIDIRIFLIIISVFLIVLVLSKIVSLSSICAAISYPITTFTVSYIDYNKLNGSIYYVAICTVISLITALIVIFKHKSNILRLISGNEKKITSKK